MIFNQKNVKGFTLIEMILVMVIITSLLLMMMTYTTAKTDETRRDFTVTQYEQILNAGMAYYINTSSWPTSVSQLTSGSSTPLNIYLPKTPYNSWGSEYTFYNNATTGTFSICSVIKGKTIATTPPSYTAATQSGIMAGRLPMAYVASGGTCPTTTTPPNPATSTTPCEGNTCLLVSTINIPGQNLNNARSVNFAGLYHNGACVPAPSCPNPYSATNPQGMKPTIIVAPVSVSGTSDAANPTNVFPLSSFTAYAVGDGTTGTSLTKSDPKAQPAKCTTSTPTACDFSGGGIPSPAGLYWRVCLNVVTETGKISGVNWKDSSGTVMAITRCVPYNEPMGSGFSVFQSY